jgi:hypothetical protein
LFRAKAAGSIEQEELNRRTNSCGAWERTAPIAIRANETAFAYPIAPRQWFLTLSAAY